MNFNGVSCIVGEGGMICLKAWLEIGVCGSSMLIDEIEAKLKKTQGIHVRRLGNSLAEAAMEVKMLSPHAVIHEMRDSDQQIAAALFHDHPKIKLIGFETECDSIVFFFAGEQVANSAEELTRVFLMTGDE